MEVNYREVRAWGWPIVILRNSKSVYDACRALCAHAIRSSRPEFQIEFHIFIHLASKSHLSLLHSTHATVSASMNTRQNKTKPIGSDVCSLPLPWLIRCIRCLLERPRASPTHRVELARTGITAIKFLKWHFMCHIWCQCTRHRHGFMN